MPKGGWRKGRKTTNTVIGPIYGTETMLVRLRRRGREQRKLEARLNDLRLFDVDTEASPDDRVDPVTGAVINTGGRSRRKYTDHPSIQLMLERRDQYLRVQEDCRVAITALAQATQIAQAIMGGPGTADAKARAIGSIGAAVGNLTRLQAQAGDHLTSIQNGVTAVMGSIHSQTKLETTVVLEDIKRIRASQNRKHSNELAMPSAADLLAVTGTQPDAQEESLDPDGDEPEPDDLDDEPPEVL